MEARRQRNEAGRGLSTWTNNDSRGHSISYRKIELCYRLDSNKRVVPMPKWKLGANVMKPDAAYPPGRTPQTGDIAYRNEKSHYAIVESAAGGGKESDVVTVNGNTAGEDNLGGQIQTRTHKLSNWTAFFNPLAIMQGSLRDAQDTSSKPKTLRELRKELFQVNRMAESGEEHLENAEAPHVQAKKEPGAALDRQIDRRVENEHQEEEIPEDVDVDHITVFTKADPHAPGPDHLQRRAEP